LDIIISLVNFTFQTKTTTSMLKSEPILHYFYEVIKDIQIPEDQQVSLLGKYYHPKGVYSYRGDFVKSPKDNLDVEHFKKICSIREVWNGDVRKGVKEWQEYLNEINRCDLKDRWIQQASTRPKTRTEIIFKEIYVDRWIPILLIERFKKWIKSKFSKEIILYEGYSKENADRDFDDLVYNYKQVVDEYTTMDGIY